MMAIGDLYTKGNGVRADQVQAQSWHAKAQSCQGGDLAMLQQQVAQLKARAAAARDPALSPILSALADNPRPSAQTRNPAKAGFDQSILVGLVAGAVIAAAIVALTPSSENANSNDADRTLDPMDAVNRNLQMNEARRNCEQGGGTPFGTTCGW
jgi:hypothetical protein